MIEEDYLIQARLCVCSGAFMPIRHVAFPCPFGKDGHRHMELLSEDGTAYVVFPIHSRDGVLWMIDILKASGTYSDITDAILAEKIWQNLPETLTAAEEAAIRSFSAEPNVARALLTSFWSA